MQHRPSRVLSMWYPEWDACWSFIRTPKDWSPATYVQAKIFALRDFLVQNQLKGGVVGISGGIDSAVVLGILHAFQQRFPDMGLQVLPVLLPAFYDSGATGQSEATVRGEAVCRQFGVQPYVWPLDALLELQQNTLDLPQSPTTPWSRGQSLSILRSACLYGAVSRWTASGVPSVVVGTTNATEGSYLGYVGKASDGLVDVQLISDATKSMVQDLAVWLNVPESVRTIPPTGDMFDGCVDEQVFGTSYPLAELWLYWKACSPESRAHLTASWSPEALQDFAAAGAHLEALHQCNHHKYTVGSPAVHLDVYDCGVMPGGRGPSRPWPWNPVDDVCDLPNWSQVAPVRPWALGERESWLAPVETWNSALGAAQPPSHTAVFMGWNNVLSEKGCTALRQELARAGHGWGLPAPANGRWRAKTEHQKSHSFRSSVWDLSLAQALWRRLQRMLPAFHVWSSWSDAHTDAYPYHVWKPIGVNPLFRVLDTNKNGLLMPHVDAPYEVGPLRRTLTSLVLYGDVDAPASSSDGALEWLNDAPEDVWPLWPHRPFLDGDTFVVDPQQCWARFQPTAGSLVIFDHRLRHQVLPASGHRWALRSDIVWQAVGPIG